MKYIIFIYIRVGYAPLKKARSSSEPCASRPQEAFAPWCVLNNYEFMIHHVPIYRKHPKYFNEEKNLEYFSFYNFFDAYETKVKIRE